MNYSEKSLLYTLGANYMWESFLEFEPAGPIGTFFNVCQCGILVLCIWLSARNLYKALKHEI